MITLISYLIIQQSLSLLISFVTGEPEDDFPGEKVCVIPFKYALLHTCITRAQRVIACALRTINLCVRVDCT